MIITYLAAPLSPEGDETLAGNIKRAKEIYAALSDKMRERVFVADWILHCEVFAGEKDDDVDLRSLGMLRNFKQIDTCHELFLTGPRISRGMAAESEYARKRGLRVVDQTRAWPCSNPRCRSWGCSNPECKEPPPRFIGIEGASFDDVYADVPENNPSSWSKER